MPVVGLLRDAKLPEPDEMSVISRPANAGTFAPGGAYLASGSVSFTVPSAAMLASAWPAITLAIEPTRRMERPFGSTLLPGRVSPKPRTTDLQVGTFPITILPTGAESRGLGAGHVRQFLPLWVQKSFGDWTTYGGGGY